MALVRGRSAVIAFAVDWTRPNQVLTAATVAHNGEAMAGKNTVFGHVIADDKPLDVFFAGDSAETRTQVADFLTNPDMRPLDVGGLEMTYVVKWAAILLMGLTRNGAGFNVALGAEIH